jgi:hypothetical protein
VGFEHKISADARPKTDTLDRAATDKPLYVVVENNQPYIEAKSKVIPRQPSLVQIKIDRKEEENVEYFKYLGIIITNDAKCKQEIKSRIAKGRAAFNNNNNYLFTRKFQLNITK